MLLEEKGDAQAAELARTAGHDTFDPGGSTPSEAVYCTVLGKNVEVDALLSGALRHFAPSDWYSLRQRKELDSNKPKPMSEAKLDVADAAQKKQLEKMKVESEPLIKLKKLIAKSWMVDLVDFLLVLATSESSWSGNMERIIKAKALCAGCELWGK